MCFFPFNIVSEEIAARKVATVDFGSIYQSHGYARVTLPLLIA